MNNNVIFFASGSNHSGEIKALSLVPGANVGVVAAYVDAAKYPAARAELDAFVETGRKVFIDSGAFAEIKFNVPERQGPKKGQLPRRDLPVGCPFVVKPLGEKHWAKVFGVYVDQALQHGENCFVVAPDKVAFQAESLERLTRYAAQMQHVYDCGATILVPIQKGELSMAEFHRRAGEALGNVDFRPAIPMKKDATTLEDLAAFCKAVQPGAIHLLGIAPDTDEGQAAIATVLGIVPDCEVSCDACLIKRWVGKANGKTDKKTGKKQPRRITALNDLHVAKLALDIEAVGAHEVHVRKALTLFLAASAYWMDNGLADAPSYVDVKIPAGCEIEPAYMDLALALWGVEEASTALEAPSMKDLMAAADRAAASLEANVGGLELDAARHAYMAQFE